MDLIDFLRAVGNQSIVERDSVIVTYNVDETITGTLVPHEVIINWHGDLNTNIIHPREDGPLISVKTMPDGMGPDVGTPITIESIISIEKL